MARAGEIESVGGNVEGKGVGRERELGGRGGGRKKEGRTGRGG